MKRLQRYILQHVLMALGAAFIALVLLMTVGLCMQLLHEGLDVVRLHGLLPPIFAYCVPVVLPSAFLTAVILTFGRFSADNELIAIRAAGIPLARVVYPVLVLGVLLSLVAGYFQFEGVPRARASIKLLKYRVLKQMLLDRVALSYKRQFSFPPIYLQYEDYEGGRMKGVVVVEIREHHPRTVVTAREAFIEGDPGEPELVFVALEDCMITRFEMRESDEPRTLKTPWMLYEVRVAPQREDVLAHRKHLPFAELMSRLRELRRRVSEQPTFEDLEEALDKYRHQRARLNAMLSELERTLQTAEEKYRKFGEEEPRQQKQIIARSQARIADLQQARADLQAQQAQVAEELAALRGERADLERLVQLQRQHRELLARIEENREQQEDLKEDVAEAEARIQESGRRAAERLSEVQELRQRKETLEEDRRKVRQALKWADDQGELIAIRVRIHKRLAQAASVLVFAFLGIPLGIMASRRSVMIAFGLSFALVLLVFYPFLIIGQMAAESGAVPVVPAMWAGNSLTFAIGAVLTFRVLTR